MPIGRQGSRRAGPGWAGFSLSLSLSRFAFACSVLNSASQAWGETRIWRLRRHGTALAFWRTRGHTDQLERNIIPVAKTYNVSIALLRKCPGVWWRFGGQTSSRFHLLTRPPLPWPPSLRLRLQLRVRRLLGRSELLTDSSGGGSAASTASAVAGKVKTLETEGLSKASTCPVLPTACAIS